MNDKTTNESSDLRAELTEITAPADVAAPVNDNHAAALREAWLAFGQLIDERGPSLDEQALVRHIQLNTARRSWRRRMVVASLAASVLLMASVVWQRLKPGALPGVPGGASQVAEKHVPVAPQPKRSTPIAQSSNKIQSPPVKVAPSAFGSDRLAWDDQLDRQVNRMQRDVRSIQRPREAEPDPIAVLRSKIDLLGRDARSDRL